MKIYYIDLKRFRIGSGGLDNYYTGIHICYKTLSKHNKKIDFHINTNYNFDEMSESGVENFAMFECYSPV
ncbi:hypothetical protein BLOT_008826 [Blomia tropicalis]|nr:hypothetical protein BLOT_008826 [Blomia tropicalis]